MSETPSIAAGDRIGKFIVTKHLGAGGMGTVYEARDPELSRAVAIKLVLDRAAHPIRLLREAQALARISHPNVVAVYELGSHGSDVFVAMELIDGVTIDRYIAEHACTWREVISLYVQAGRGLAAVHEQGLVHRDIKPSNILVDREGRVRVGDFGLARRDDRDGDDTISAPGGNIATPSSLAETIEGPTAASIDLRPDPVVLDAQITEEGAVIGTPRYMAPEQLAGARVTRRADQYSFAIALWEAVYGSVPGERREAPAGATPASWVERILARALSRSPGDRWPTMAAFLDELERAPRRRSRIVIGAASVAALGGVTAALFGLGVIGGERGVSCERAGDPVGVRWTADARTRINSAFGALGAAWTKAGEPAIAELDRWTARAKEVRIDACRATHERGSQTAALLDKRIACLDAQQPVFDALVAALGHVDRSVAEHAQDAIERLPSPELCTAARLVDATAVRSGPIDKTIADTTIAVDLQRPDARALADQLVAASQGQPPAIKSRAELLHGRLIAATDPKAGHDELAAALEDAAAARDPGLEAEVLLATLVIAAQGESSDRIEALVPMTKAAVTRAGNPRPLARELAKAEIGVHARLGHAEPAKAACDRLLTLEEPAAAERSTSMCQCRIALVLRERSAVELCRTTLALTRKAFGDSHPQTLDRVHDLITALVRIRAVTEAEPAARANLELAISLYGRDSTQVVYEMQLLSVVLDRLDRVAESRKVLEDALAISDRVSGPDAAARSGLLLELADRATQQKDKAAIQYADSGLAAAERALGPDHRDLAAVLMIHARATALDPTQLPRSLESYRRALALSEKYAGPKSQTFAATLSSYSFFLAYNDRFEEAIAPMQRAVPLFDALGEKQSAATGNGLIGELLIELKRPAEARPYLIKARATFVELKLDEEIKDIDMKLAKTR